MSDGRGVPGILWEPEVHYCVDTTPSLAFVLSQMNLILIFGTRLTLNIPRGGPLRTPEGDFFVILP